MKYIIIMLIVCIIPEIINRMPFGSNKTNTKSIYEFVMRPYKDIAFLGKIGAGFIIIVMGLGVYLNQISSFVIAGGLSFFALCALLMLAPSKGFWDEEVKNDIIIVRRFWIFKKTINISDIDYCVTKRGGINVYIKNKRNKAFQIDGMSTNISNFEERMQKEGIEFR